MAASTALNFATLVEWTRSIADILLLAFLLYKVWQFLVTTQAVSLLRGAVVLGAFWAAAWYLKLQTVSWILTTLAPGLVIALAIVFQPELRRTFTRLGQGPLFRGRSAEATDLVDAVVNAAEMLSSTRRGALVVFGRSSPLSAYAETGTGIDSLLSSSLVIAIFGYDTPLHDGAIIVQNGRLAAAGCFLPLSEQQDIRKTFGTRHRAALGLSEATDAVVLVVSEESGAISLAHDSRLHYDLGAEQARRRLYRLLSAGETEQEDGGE